MVWTQTHGPTARTTFYFEIATRSIACNNFSGVRWGAKSAQLFAIVSFPFLVTSFPGLFLIKKKGPGIRC